MMIDPIRFGRTIAATLMVAALAASCASDGTGSAGGGAPDVADGSTAAVDEADNEATTAWPMDNGSWPGTVNLGRHEHGGGQGSAAAVAAAAVDLSGVGSEWVVFNQPVELLPACRFGPSRGAEQWTFVQGATNESFGIRIDMYDSQADAFGALDQALGSGFKACAEDTVEQVNELAQEAGVYNTVEGEAVGEVEPSLVADHEGGTRRYVLEARGDQTSLDFELASTYYVVEQALVLVEVSSAEDAHEQVTAEGDGLIDDEVLVWTPDATIDDAVDRLRSATLGPESPADFYQLGQAGQVVDPTDFECNGPPAGSAEFQGPVWSTQQGISAIIQSGSTYPDEAAAQAAAATLSDADLICIYEDVSQFLIGDTTYVGGTVEVVEQDGQELTVVDIEITQQLPSGNAIVIDVAHISVFVRNGPDLLSWQFIGVRGDEPDMVQLALDASAKLSTAGAGS